MKNDWQLTDKEVEKAWDMFLGEHPDCQWDSNMAGKMIAREAQKKLVKWLVFEKLQGTVDYGGHPLWVITVDTLKELCKALDIKT